MSLLVSLRATNWPGKYLAVGAGACLAPTADFGGPESTFVLDRVQGGWSLAFRAERGSGPVVLDRASRALAVRAGPAAPEVFTFERNGEPLATVPFNQPLTLNFAGSRARVADPAGEIAPDETAPPVTFALHLAMPYVSLEVADPIVPGPPRPSSGFLAVDPAAGAVLISQREPRAQWLALAQPDGHYLIQHKLTGCVLSSYGQASQRDLLHTIAWVAQPGQTWELATDDGDGVTIRQGQYMLASGPPNRPVILESSQLRQTRWRPQPVDAIDVTLFTMQCPGTDRDTATGLDNRRFAAWMSFIRDDVRLVDLVLPGTHQSATHTFSGPVEFFTGARCQDVSVLDQLLLGVRYLDLRVRLDGDRPVTERGVRAGGLKEVLGQIRLFLEQAPTEILVLDIQLHKYDLAQDLEGKVVELLESQLSAGAFAAAECLTQPPAPRAFNAAVTLGDLRRVGRRLVVFLDKEPASARPWLINRDLGLFSLWDDGWKTPAFPATEQDSKRPFAPPRPLEEKDRTDYILSSLNTAIASRGTDPRLFVAQVISSPWVSPMRGPSNIEDRDGPVLTEWVESLGHDVNVNVIMRDFIDRNRSTVVHALSLNVWKQFTADTAGGPSLNALLDPEVKPSQLDFYSPFGVVATSGQAVVAQVAGEGPVTN